MRFSSRPLAIALLAAGILLLAVLMAEQAKGASDPGLEGPCAVTSQDVEISGTAARVFYPSTTACGSHAAKPFAAIAFAHGFSMFGLSDGVSENVANGEHLASWGYVVVIPELPDDAEERAGILTDSLSFLESANKNSSSFLYGKVDNKRLTTAGYSLGGATALAVAARDKRVTAVVALDPVYHTGNFGGEGDPIWDPVAEAPKITVPAGILGAPASSCNAEADYAEIYPLVGSDHKASYFVTGASHCVFADPGSSFCSFVCNGGTAPEMTSLSKKYMSAWFNYYVQLKPDFYTYLFGARAQADVDAGSIEMSKNTYPTSLTAGASFNSVRLSWDYYAHPIVAWRP
jgi:dienelactone hydrolase